MAHIHSFAQDRAVYLYAGIQSNTCKILQTKMYIDYIE